MPENPDQTKHRTCSPLPKNLKSMIILQCITLQFTVICCMQQCLFMLHIQPRTLKQTNSSIMTGVFHILSDILQYSFFPSFGLHLVNNVSDQSQVSISADKSFSFQSCLKTFLVGWLYRTKISRFFMTYDRFLSAEIVGHFYLSMCHGLKFILNSLII